MKIVFLAPFGIRPKGTVLARMVPLAVELKKLGHDPVIIAPPYTNPEDSGREENVKGVNLKNVRLGPKNRALAAPVLARRMFRAALDEKPDLVHLFKPKGYGGLAMMMLRIAGKAGSVIPHLFLDCDDLEGKRGMNLLHDYTLPERTLYSFQERWLPPRMVGVTVASRYLGEVIAGMGVGRKRLLYLPNCVVERPQGNGQGVRARLGIPRGAQVILLYTRFFEFSQENLYLLFAELKRRVPDVRFLVVGAGRHGEEKSLAAAAREGGFADSLFIAGWLQPAEIPDHLASGDLAVYPFADTPVNRAKCPAKLTELLAAGVPVVADRVGQIPEYLAPELDDLLCNPGDVEGMADRCVELLADPDKRRMVSLTGREYLQKNFSWSAAARELARFYETLVTKG